MVLARSWNNAPTISQTSTGLIDEGYDRYQRAYVLRLESNESKQWSFTVQCSKDSPLVNPCFVFKNWRNAGNVSMKIGGQPITLGPAFRQGIEYSAEGGEPSLVVWVKNESTSPVTFTVLNGAMPE
jgi:hypothetical protein